MLVRWMGEANKKEKGARNHSLPGLPRAFRIIILTILNIQKTFSCAAPATKAQIMFKAHEGAWKGESSSKGRERCSRCARPAQNTTMRKMKNVPAKA